MEKVNEKHGNLLEACDMSQFAEVSFEYLPCQKLIKLKPEDEISMDSIISALIDMVKPLETEFEESAYTWDVHANEMRNEKHAVIFEEQLYISKLKDTACRLTQEPKIFLDKELFEVGNYKLNVEESFDGYAVFSTSKMVKGKENTMCGHCLRGKYDNRFMLIAELRNEFDYVDNARIEKILDLRVKEDELIATRETTIHKEAQRFQAVVNIKGRDDVFLGDGGVLLLMRYLIINSFIGNYQYYSMNLFGKIIRCVLEFEKERKQLQIFHRKFVNVIRVINTQYFNDVIQETSETFYNREGHMLLHFWHNYNYLIHSVRAPPKPKEHILPKLELKWKSDNIMFAKYQNLRRLSYKSALHYLSSHPEVSDFLNDYILTLLKYKPNNVLKFTVKFFQNMRNSY